MTTKTTKKTQPASITAAHMSDSFKVLKETFNYANIMQSPQITKVIVSVGVGSVKDKKRREYIAEQLGIITGQKVSVQKAKKSIATFKVREGDLAGYRVTLRGDRMYSFLDKLIHVVLPRTRDFRGISPKVIDEMGNASIGIKEHTVFPEAAEADLKDVFGFGITIVTTAKTPAETEAVLRHIGFPLQK